MATTSNIKNGAVILHKNRRMKVIEFQHVKPGKGGAFVRTKMKDIQTGKILDETFNSGAKLEFIKVEAKAMQFLYKDGDEYVFMDNQSFDQINVNGSLLIGKGGYLISGINVDILFDEKEILDVRLPAHVVLQVKSTEPGFKGNTSTGALKPAILETELEANVALFINVGDYIKVDTRSGYYVERIKK